MNFGEILEPSSRAFWDDFDDEQDETDPRDKFDTEIEWNWMNKDNIPPDNLKVSLFFVVEGSGIFNFIKSTVIKELEPIGKSKNGNVLAYYIPKSYQLICFSQENDLNFSAKTTLVLKQLILKAENVNTFSLQSKIQYKGDDIKENENMVTFFYGINSKINNVKELQAPNFVTGITAAVSTLRFIENLPFSSYIGYTDPMNDLDAFSAEPILKLFKEIGIKCDSKYVAKYKEQSHLYM